MFNALVMEQNEEGLASANLKQIGEDALSEGNVTVAVEYSTVNYKDGLCLSAKGGGLVRNYPHVPGIDFAGTVESSDDMVSWNSIGITITANDATSLEASYDTTGPARRYLRARATVNP